MDGHLKKVIKKCLKNDRKAQIDLYHSCFDHLMRTCRRYKRNREDAVSLLNDGFLKVLLNLEQYDFKREFFHWISTIMVRTAIDDYRKNRKYTEETDYKETDEELEHANLGQAHVQVIEKLSAEELWEMINCLPANEKMVFNLYELEGYQHHEIAERMAVSERTTKRYLKTAKQKLKQMIEKHSNLKNVV